MTYRWITSAFVVALSTVAVAGCNKAKPDDADAAASAVAAASAAVDAAAVAVAPDAGDPLGNAVDAGVAPLATSSAKVAVPARPVAKPDPPICQTARSARHRNSPTAPNLEAQCKAAGGTM